MVTNVPGPFALIEFTSALPRARLYTHWEVLDDPQTLARLADPAFDPTQSLLLAPGADVPASQVTTNAAAILEPVEFLSYAPKHLTLRARTSTPAVLLLNDKHDPRWRVTRKATPNRCCARITSCAPWRCRPENTPSSSPSASHLSRSSPASRVCCSPPPCWSCC
ncbi:MAG: hypothetical protein M5U12_02280 [Verrucomicrobia bacterium]|nr:hypothetical protein [Verrucomicrobiota bacterium]